MSCQNITPREEFQRQLEEMNPDAAAAIKRMVEAELLLKKQQKIFFQISGAGS